ncbi:MAG: hypothetical protein MPEBLZ_03356 [Candidatus Methanoperedens nitroreducens]|uniref:Uncharacterized protein n=1 Tax=Candidatus Methanoperedens nitratireducens TaxID=1392998 RepID=A0A0P8A699_9EURY|nr:hypothetical protein [Candidatus Methanoperedens sp. BLZ2]KPQ42095.1 MAG: hypothetical protein MPEBLZ_03356 [Candidatus Methanoperedens sp. BLZ1]MBZ0177006.1 hypothetical protein [Candidatus Methanoperedens nitroreducens]MCX9078186.1 hypothetical protein [Candidatus Methanoperedens sp.]
MSKNKNITIEVLGLWEKLSNPDFKPLEFERFRNEAGNNYFVLSPQRGIESTNEIAIRQLKTLMASNIRELEADK